MFLKLKIINKPINNFNKNYGFSLIELLIVIAIMVFLIFLSFPLFRSFQKQSDLIDSAEKIVNGLRMAQNKTLASDQDDQWGVFFTTSTSPHQYVLFKGSDYQSRDDSFDTVYQLVKSVEISEINLNQESFVAFKPITGQTDQFGNILIRLKNDYQKTSIIYIEPFGQISLIESLMADDSARIKDSRVVQFNYDRLIDLSEKLILTFNQDVVEEINIQDFIEGDQFFWQGEIDVQGEKQEIKIHTLEFNNPQSLFCVHRSRQNNNKSLKIEISGDSSGYLIEYSADGLLTFKTSIYATDPQWQ